MNKAYDMDTKFLIIGVGGAGCKAADIIDIPNSKKLFIDTDSSDLINLKSNGDKIQLECEDRDKCSSIHCHLYCYCIEHVNFFTKVMSNYKELIKYWVKEAFEEGESRDGSLIHYDQ